MTKEKKVTKRDNFTEIASILAEAGREDLAQVMNHEIELLDKKAEKAKETAAKKNAASDALAEAVQNALTDEFATIADITAKVNTENSDVSTAKVQYRLNNLVKNGVAVKEQVKVGEGDSARKLMSYKIA